MEQQPNTVTIVDEDDYDKLDSIIQQAEFNQQGVFPNSDQPPMDLPPKIEDTPKPKPKLATEPIPGKDSIPFRTRVTIKMLDAEDLFYEPEVTSVIKLSYNAAISAPSNKKPSVSPSVSRFIKPASELAQLQAQLRERQQQKEKEKEDGLSGYQNSVSVGQMLGEQEEDFANFVIPKLQTKLKEWAISQPQPQPLSPSANMHEDAVADAVAVAAEQQPEMEMDSMQVKAAQANLMKDKSEIQQNEQGLNFAFQPQPGTLQQFYWNLPRQAQDEGNGMEQVGNTFRLNSKVEDEKSEQDAVDEQRQLQLQREIRSSFVYPSIDAQGGEGGEGGEGEGLPQNRQDNKLAEIDAEKQKVNKGQLKGNKIKLKNALSPDQFDEILSLDEQSLREAVESVLGLNRCNFEQMGFQDMKYFLKVAFGSLYKPSIKQAEPDNDSDGDEEQSAQVSSMQPARSESQSALAPGSGPAPCQVQVQEEQASNYIEQPQPNILQQPETKLQSIREQLIQRMPQHKTHLQGMSDEELLKVYNDILLKEKEEEERIRHKQLMEEQHRQRQENASRLIEEEDRLFAEEKRREEEERRKEMEIQKERQQQLRKIYQQQQMRKEEEKKREAEAKLRRQQQLKAIRQNEERQKAQKQEQKRLRQLISNRIPSLKNLLGKATLQELRGVYATMNEQPKSSSQHPKEVPTPIQSPPSSSHSMKMNTNKQSNTNTNTNTKTSTEVMLNKIYGSGQETVKRSIQSYKKPLRNRPIARNTNIDIAKMRKLLMEKMPSYKDGIMGLSDKQLHELYMQSCKEEQNQAREKEKEKRTVNRRGGSGSETQTQTQTAVIALPLGPTPPKLRRETTEVEDGRSTSMPYPKTQVYQTPATAVGKKRSRTLLIHVFEDNEGQGYDQPLEQLRSLTSQQSESGANNPVLSILQSMLSTLIQAQQGK